ncbi:MAG TPA: GNAT family N-acetyltransferase [Solirubrobacteraceae bacterium]
MDIVEFGPLTQELRAELEGDEEDPFDIAGVALQFRPKERHVALRDGDGRLIASTGMLVVEAEVGDQRIPIVGLGGVIVNSEHRGRGLARRVVRAALERGRAMGPSFALLFCLPSRAGLYERLGFETLPPPVTVEQPAGIEEMPLGAMWHALAAGAEWPAGPVALRSLPF